MFMETKDPVEKASSSFSSLKSVKLAIESGGPAGQGQVIDISGKKDRFSLGYKPYAKIGALVPTKDDIQSIQEVFLNTCFVHGERVNIVEDDTAYEEIPNLVYQCEVSLTNWEAIEIP